MEKLLDYFYGEEHLKLFCGAREFKEFNESMVSFRVKNFSILLLKHDIVNKNSVKFEMITMTIYNLEEDNSFVSQSRCFIDDLSNIKETFFYITSLSMDF